MPKFTPNAYLSVDQYAQAVDTLHILCGMVLFEFAKGEGDVREQILRNFVARADIIAQAVVRLWQIHDYQDCWILHRSLLDRLFHLRALHDRNEFEVFEAWSFMKQYEAIGRLKSDPDTKDIREDVVVEPSEAQRQRHKDLAQNPPSWRRPKAEDTAKAMDLGFLYRYGYDFASTHVHPMANDGQEDFYYITGLEPKPKFPDWRVVLSNSVLVASMIVQEALNASRARWHETVYAAIDGVRRFLANGSPSEYTAVAKVAAMFSSGAQLSSRNQEQTFVKSGPGTE